MRRGSTLSTLAMALALAACEPPAPPVPARLEDPGARVSGRGLFLEHCAICHGERADGHGRRRASLSAPPADFTDPSWASRTPPHRTFQIIREGLRRTSMPAWKVLSDAETWDLVAYLHSVAEQGAEVGP